jgi:TolA-binding protein
MWGRRSALGLLILLAVIGLAGVLGGCASRSDDAAWSPAFEEPGLDEPSPAPDEEKPPPSARRQLTPRDIEDFDAAVEMVTRLEYAAAEREFRQLLVRFGATDEVKYVTETLFWLGYCLEKQSLVDEARKYYQRLADKYPDSPAAGQARRRLAYLREQ